MLVDTIMPILGPIVLSINILIIFLCMRPKYNVPFTIGVLAAYAVGVHFLTTIIIQSLTPSLVRFSGVLFTPVMLWLFKGQTFQKMFVIFMPYQLGALITHIVDALVGVTIGYEDPNAAAVYITFSLIILAVYVLLVRLYGRKLFDRIFVNGGNGMWALYALGAMFSFVLVLTLDWRRTGAWMYFALILFIIWSVGVLLYTIINTHEKAAQAHQTETLLLQMKAMREQTDIEIKRRGDMEILRHDMRHEMAAIMELFRTGKETEAEAVYADWQKSLAETAPASVCAEPVLNAVFSRFERLVKDMNISLHVSSNIPAVLPIDTVKLSVILSNALENAAAAVDKVTDREREIFVRLIQNGEQIGLETINPYAGLIEFDGKGLPVTREPGHGIGTRSIAAFADDNGHMLEFNARGGMFTMRLLMTVNG